MRAGQVAGATEWEEAGLADAVAVAYEAATGGGNRFVSGSVLRHLVGAHMASLHSLTRMRATATSRAE